MSKRAREPAAVVADEADGVAIELTKKPIAEQKVPLQALAIERTPGGEASPSTVDLDDERDGARPCRGVDTQPLREPRLRSRGSWRGKVVDAMRHPFPLRRLDDPLETVFIGPAPQRRIRN